MAPQREDETAEDLKKRRRIQNRVNQRARRQRIKHKDDQCDDAPAGEGQQSYQVQRWRLDEEWPEDDKQNECNSQPSNLISKKPAELPPWRCGQDWDPKSPISLGTQCAYRASQVYKFKAALSSDHALIDLIHYNVFFSLFHNKSLLEEAAMFFTPGRSADEPWVPFVGEAYPGRAAIMPTTPRVMPLSLKPTPLQMATVHATWINLVPFPQMRDNLIICEEVFDHEDFVHDVVGDFIDSSFFSHPGRIPDTSSQTPQPQKAKKKKKKKQKEKRTENGMILWGQPHDVANWEVTKEFIRRWGWTLKGCDDLIVASNRWRVKRGEPPLALPSALPSTA